MRVVIADDDRLARHFLASVLQDVDVPSEVVSSVGSAQEVIDAAAEHQPELALVDFTMPGGGPAAARGIRRVSPGTSVIAVSAHDDMLTVREMLQAGATTYLVKGMPVDELVEVLGDAARAASSGPRAPVTHAEPVERRISVLLVESDAVTLDALAEVVSRTATLNLIGLAQTAFHAASLAARHRPDVALVSEELPGGGGGARVAAEIASVSPSTRLLSLRSTTDAGGRRPHRAADDGDAGDALAWAIHQAADARPAQRGDVEPRLLERLRRRARTSGTLPRRRFERLRCALAAESLPMMLQPIVRLSDAQPIGYEALARFPSNGSQAASPDVWFADARRLGVAVDLELLAVRSAMAELPHLPGDAFLAVNVSPDTVLAPALAELVAVDPERVVLELTEHAAVDDYEELRASLDELRATGIRVAVDDCGAGFASLRHVALVAPDFLKLDVVLCRDIREPARAALARALVMFAAETGSHVIAEGIEAHEDLHALRELGVTMGQGYLLARPAVPADMFSAR